MKILFFDLETTGVDCTKNGIHQISGEIVIDGETKETFNLKVQPHPDAIIEKEALDVAGVTKEQIMAYPPMAEIYSQFVAMLAKHVDKFNKADKFFLAGYNNASFDNQFLREFFARNNDKYFGSWFWSNSIDVMVLASQDLLEKREGMANFKLVSVAKEYGLVVSEEKLHDANYDIYLTKSIYELITKPKDKPMSSNLNNYLFAQKLDIFKAKILDPHKIKVEKAEAIMHDTNHPWKDDEQRKAGQAQYDAYKAWLLVYQTHYDEGMKLCAQHEKFTNLLSKWYARWFDEVSNEGKQETEMMSMQADTLCEIFTEIYQELKPLGLDIKAPAALNLK